MQRQNVRVILAAEYPEMRYFLKEAVERAGGAVIVGQAQDAIKALTLTRSLRPDVAIIDSYLPHVVGLDAVPLSRIGGLDAAQTIAEEIPKTRVVLLSNLDQQILPEYTLIPDSVVLFSKKTNGATLPFTLQELCQEGLSPSSLVFADVEVKPQAAPQQKVSNLTDRAIFFGGLGIAGGWLLILTIFLAPVGMFFTLAGAATVLLGLGGKLTTALWRRATSDKQSREKKVTTKS